MLENGPFCKVDAGARLFLDEKVAASRHSRPAWCIDCDHKKEVVSVRVMREVSHRLVIFLSGTRKKCWKMARFVK